MDSQTIRTALGLLQDDPENRAGWQSLAEAVSVAEGDLDVAGLLELLEAARLEHMDRGEWDAVVALYDLALLVARDTEQEPSLLAEAAQIRGDELLDELGARALLERLFDLAPDEATMARLEQSGEKQSKWRELAAAYDAEAAGAADDVYASSMLMRAAETMLRWGGAEAEKAAILERFEQAVKLDVNNERAVRHLERSYRIEERWEDAARVLERFASRAEQPAARVRAGMRLGRLALQRIGDQERAVKAWVRVLEDAPDHAPAKEKLAEIFSREERWEELVRLYEQELSRAEQSSARIGDMLQIAMLHWKKLGRSLEAEPWFERVRKLEPANGLVLAFYRDYLAQTGDDARLIAVLQAAQRAASDDDEKARLASELARLTETQLSAQKAIEQYKSVLRHDPDNVDAREALKRLYKQTEGYNALVELLRQQLERTSTSDYAARLAILRDVAQVYRTYIKSDTALVSVLNQIVQLDEKVDAEDADELRELCALYEKLGRWRDLLTYQLKLAEVSRDAEEKVRLYRAAGKRWLEQFTNVQNATEAYEALIKLVPDDADARDRLEELYRKRRAWPALYDLFEHQLERVSGSQRIAVMKEMAQLAAERLNRGADAVRLYQQILEEEPGRTEILDALEKYAERARDWGTLASALERRVELLSDEKERLAILQKLGAVYSDHLQDHAKSAHAWRRVLELHPGHHRALRVLRDAYLEGGDLAGLEELYASQNDFEGLAEVLGNAADKAKDPTVKIALSYRAAGVYEERLGQPDRAFRSYERILSADPTDARAALALIPLYEKDEKWARVPALYEVLLEHSQDEGERVELLERLVEITGMRLSDRRAALAYARRAYTLDPAGTLGLLAATSRAAGQWETFVSAVEERLSESAADPEAEGGAAASGPGVEERRMLELELARVYAEELGRSGDAVPVLRGLLARDPSDSEAAGVLEAILRREDRRDDLRWLLELRVQHAETDEDRVRILLDWAMLEEDVFESPAGAITLYQRVLELDPVNPAALTTLPRLLLGAGQVADAAEIVARDRDRLFGSERAAREVDLAELYAGRLEAYVEAAEAAVRALELVPQFGRAIDLLEKLQSIEVSRARAARVLAESYASSGDARREARSLALVVAEAADPAERLELQRLLADVYERKLSAYGSALDVVLAAVRDNPAELELWDRADALAQASGRPTDLAQNFREVLTRELPRELECELSERAARLHEDRLGDPMGATPYLEKVLALEPGNDRAFLRLKDIFTAAERWSELEAMYDRATEVTTDPARKTEMLVEVALVCEEIVEDPQRATQYYERILKLDPSHDGALRALDRLYGDQKRYRDLEGLLERRWTLAEGEEDDAIELELRIARLELDQLLQPEKAVGHVEHVLELRPNDRDARALAERLLDIGSLRMRAARMLESVYEARDEIRDLVRVLVVQLEETEAAARVSGEDVSEARRVLLQRIATLRDQRLHDDEGAFEALASLLPLDPEDAEARGRFQEIGRRLGLHERVASVLLETAERATTPTLVGEILMRVAFVYQELLNDSARAETVYRRVLGLEPDDAELVVPAARALEELYIASQASDRLVEMLRLQVRLEESSERRAELFGRIGELCRDVLGDDVGAIAAFRSRAEEQPSDDGALAALDGLYEKAGRWRDLVLVLERRRDLADGSARRSLMTRSAKVLAERLSSPQEAIAAWRAVVDEFGPDDESLHALEQLFRATERWDELAETYEQHLDIVTSDGRRLELLADLGDLRQAHLSDPAGALVAYRVALKVTATHGRSRRALEALLDAQDASIRRDSAEVLRPIFEVDGDHAKLLKVLEIEVDTADDPLDKLEKLDKAIQVAEGSLGDAERAHSYARRAVRTAVGHTELSPWLTRLEGLAERTDRLAEYVALLEEIVPEIFDGDVQLAVTLRIADLARNRLGDRERARQYYDRALELRADDPTALLALESLYEESNDAPNLLTILERRVEIAASDEERKALHFRRAVLLADVLGDRARAIEVYELILEIGLDPRALVALETLYTAESRWADLIALYERELESTTNAAALHVKIARVAAQRQKDLGRAFEELERALELERQHTGAIEELERLLAEADDAEPRARAAVLLEPVYLVRADFSRVMATLRARLAFSQDPEERRELLARLAQLYEEQQEDYVQALETTARLLHEDITSESTMAELERLAKVAGAARRLAEVYAGEVALHESDDEATARIARRAAELFVELGELERALVLYQRVLAFAPEDAAVFTATDRLLERMGRHEERIELQRHALDHRFEPVERLAIFHTVARLERRELGRPDAAIDTYREALDVDESDVTALDALTELYAERGRHTDLGELYLRRAEAAERVEQSAQFRLSLARLYRKELKDDDRAIEQLEEIVRGQSGHAEAIRELEALLTEPALKERVVDILRPLYEAQDNWRHTIKLNEERFALAGAPGDQVAVLRETAELWEKRGNDQDKARRALRHAFEIDPDDAEVRQDLERLTGATRSWLDLADLYDAALEARPDLASARDLLEVVSRIADERLDDPRRALGAYRRLFRADPTELLPLEKVEQLAILLSDWPVLVEALAAKAELLLEDAERASAWRRIGEAKRDMLEDADGAVAAYEQALELEPDSSFTVDCLIGLYEERSEPERLVELLERRVELAGDSDPDQVYELLVQAASVYEERLADRPKAIDVAARALAVKPGDAAALARLDRLYRAEERWSELLDNLRLEASLAESVEDRARLRREMGRVLADKLDSPEEAVEAYRLVLDESPRDADTVQAVRLIAERHEELRSRVAALLEPVLRSTERWEELTAVLELRLGTESDPAERAATLRAIADVNETRLGRPGQALEAVLRAIAERPEDMALHTEAERLAELASGYPEYADALSERAEATFDPETAKDLFSRLGRIADEKLKDDARAVEAYGRALEQGGDDLALLEALDRIHTRTGDARALADVLERRSTLEPSDEAQAELSYRLGLLQIRDFEEPGRGLASLRQALERVPSHRGALEELEKLTAKRELFEEASEVLEGVYRTLADNGKLAWLYEKRVDRAEDRGARVEQRKNLARVLEEDVKDPSRAQQVLQAALADDPADSGLLDELERLAAVNSAFPAAAEALRNAVDARGELLPEVSRDLTVRAALWLRDRTNDRDGAERAYVKALTFDPASDEVLEAIAELQSAAGRERDLAATLRKRAKLQVDDERRVELYKRARELAAGLADAALAEEVLRELLAQDEANAWALAELTELRAAAGDHKETYALLIRRIDVAVGGEELFALRHRAAKLAREELGKPELAIELYQALFDDRPEDVVASQALRELYAQAAAWQDLGRLLERLIDMADSPEARANLRIELARLEAERDRAYDRAIELLRAVLEELPGHGQAVVALSELFEQTKRDEELAELLDGQIAAARERGDQESELTFLMRLGEICVSRLDDKRRAVETYEAVLARDPRHRRALESLAQLYASLDQGAEAARVLETLLDLSSGAEAVELAATLADTRSKLGDTDGVARALERGLAAEERNATLRSRLAALYEANQDYEKLAALIARSAELTDAVPEQVKLLRQAAELQATKRQDRAAAARLLERASELDPSNRELLLELCDAYSASGKGAAAVQVLEKIVESFGGKRSKELAEIHRRLADAYLAENEKEKALGELDKAFRIEPGNVTVLKKLGEVALDAGDLKKAQQMFRALLLQRLDEKSPITKAEVFFMLGEVHLKENDLPKAKQQYERAVQTDSSFTRAKQRLEELK